MMELDDITFKIMGCSVKVHNTQGNGFQEVIYQPCLAIELEKYGLSFEREKEHTIFYEDAEVGIQRAYFGVAEKVIAELKALINLEPVHLAQAKNYGVAYDFEVGLLIHFGSESLQYKNIFHPVQHPKKSPNH